MHALLSNAPLWGLVLGVITPVFAALVQQPAWGRQVKVAVAVIVAAVIGAVSLLAQGDLSSTHLSVETLTAVVGASQAAYHGLWKRTGWTDAIEQATSFLYGRVKDAEPQFGAELAGAAGKVVGELLDPSAVAALAGPGGDSPLAPLVNLAEDTAAKVLADS